LQKPRFYHFNKKNTLNAPVLYLQKKQHQIYYILVLGSFNLYVVKLTYHFYYNLYYKRKLSQNGKYRRKKRKAAQGEKRKSTEAKKAA
jgi:hypothetical protein